jgi:PTH1 family peptidyl-tRNA hydrolase
VPKAVVGLGNPGSRYAETRHNAGFMLVELLARRHGAKLAARRHEAAWAEIELAGERTILIEPLAYMNRSGPPVAAFATELGIEPDAILVAHDDLDLPPARIRLKRAGGTAGHRGLESLVEALGTRDFPRLRIGIGRPPEGMPVRRCAGRHRRVGPRRHRGGDGAGPRTARLGTACGARRSVVARRRGRRLRSAALVVTGWSFWEVACVPTRL